MAHWTIIPALLLTFMFGPAGLLVFIAQRAARRLGRKTEAVTPFRLPDWLRASEPRLISAGLVMLATLAPTFVAYLFDDRLFGGEAIWLKPMRFEISLSIYMITRHLLSACRRSLPYHRARKIRRMGRHRSSISRSGLCRGAGWTRPWLPLQRLNADLRSPLRDDGCDGGRR
jgi:hypothetical protein